MKKTSIWDALRPYPTILPLSAAAEAAHPLQTGLLVYVLRDGNELAKAGASTAASWWVPGADHA